ncbi:putative sugar kinase YegV, partial [Clarias magur]
ARASGRRFGAVNLVELDMALAYLIQNDETPCPPATPDENLGSGTSWPRPCEGKNMHAAFV